MNKFYEIFGEGENLTALQMSLRAVVIFIITLLLIRIGGYRIFGKRSAFDTILMITLGALLSRAIVGASPFLPVIGASATMIIIHRVLGFLSVINKRIEFVAKGTHTILYRDGKIIKRNLLKTSISEEDLMESLRLETQGTSLEKIEKAYLESNGRISFVLKKDPGK